MGRNHVPTRIVSGYLPDQFVSTYVGRPWWVTAIGTTAVVAYVLSAFSLGGLGVRETVFLYAGGVVGGIVAGFALGTNIYDGMVAGLRAGAYGVLVLAALAAVVFFGLWYAQSGQLFFYWASFYGAVGLLFFAPVYMLTGIVGGSVGVLLRRVVVPNHLNPAAY